MLSGGIWKCLRALEARDCGIWLLPGERPTPSFHCAPSPNLLAIPGKCLAPCFPFPGESPSPSILALWEGWDHTPRFPHQWGPSSASWDCPPDPASCCVSDGFLRLWCSLHLRPTLPLPRISKPLPQSSSGNSQPTPRHRPGLLGVLFWSMMSFLESDQSSGSFPGTCLLWTASPGKWW